MILLAMAAGLEESLLAAEGALPFPSPPDKEGLQVQMVTDAIELGVHCAAINVSLGAATCCQASTPLPGHPRDRATTAHSLQLPRDPHERSREPGPLPNPAKYDPLR